MFTAQMKMSKFQESVVQTTWPNDNYFDWWLGHNETEQLRMDYQKYLKVKIFGYVFVNNFH